MTDFDKLNEAMARRKRALTAIGRWTKVVEEAETEIKLQIGASYPDQNITIEYGNGADHDTVILRPE